MNLRLLCLLFFSIINFYNTYTQVSFSTYQSYMLGGSWVEVVAISDLNGDSLNDIVIGTGDNGSSPNNLKLFIYCQDTSGTLKPPAIYSYTSNPNLLGLQALATGDLNHDQLNDIVIGYHDTIAIFYQNQSHTLNPAVRFFSGHSITSIKIGDLNYDGLNDIAVSHKNELFITVYYQNGSVFSPVNYPKLLGNGASEEIEIGDVNSDGHNDLVLLCGSIYHSLNLYFQDTLGLLMAPVIYYPSFHYFTLGGIAIGDLNQDGRNDIAGTLYANTPYTRMFLFIQDTIPGTFHVDTLPAYDCMQPVEIADMNCDGKNEIVAANGGFSRVSVFEKDSSQQYNYSTFIIPYTSHYNRQGLSLGDINNDGKKDIAIANRGMGLILLLNNGQASPSSFTIMDTTVNSNVTYFSDSITSSFYYLQTIIDSSTTCPVTQIDSFEVKAVFHSDSIRTDSTFIRQAQLCSVVFTDTILRSHFTFHTQLISVDTLLISSQLDTLYSPMLITDTLINTTIFFTDTIINQSNFTQEQILENKSGCSIVKKEVYLIVHILVIDSLHYDSTFIRSAITCETLYRDSLFKQISLTDTSFNLIDTVLFSSSLDTLISFSNEQLLQQNVLTAFPVPSSGIVSIDFTSDCYYTNRSLNLELYDITGRIIYTSIVNTTQLPYNLDLDKFPNCIFCLKVSIGNDVCIKKLIKQK